jgi:hypothetical protein
MSGRTSLQRELDSFYRELFREDYNIRHVTKGALSQARAKLNPSAFKEMNSCAVQTFYNEGEYKAWHKMRVLAVDSSGLRLPRHESIDKQFSRYGFGPKADAEQSLARVSVLYDVLNLLTLDAEIGSFGIGEREMLDGHLDKINQGDLLLLDRGYQGFKLMLELRERKIQYCMRLNDRLLEVRKFIDSGDTDAVVQIQIPRTRFKEFINRYTHKDKDSIRVRMLRIELAGGETEILCTSLLDMDKITLEDIKELYHYRWSVEEAYKLLKMRVEVENFTGKTARAVMQDFHSKIFMMTLCAALSYPIEEKVRKEYEKNTSKRKYQINRTNALSMLRNIYIGLFLRKDTKKALDAFDNNISKTLEIVRPDRSNPRQKKLRRKFFMNYKPL